MRVFQYQTTKQALVSLLGAFISGELCDGFTGKTVYASDVLVIIDRPAPDIDLNIMGMVGAGRWRRFLKEYTDDRLATWIAQLRDLQVGEELGYSCPVIAKHNQGNCMLGFSVTSGPGMSRIALYSRTSNLVPTGAVDLSFGSLLCQSAMLETSRRTVPLYWYLGQLQLYALESLPALIQLGLSELAMSSPSRFGRMLKLELQAAIMNEPSNHHRTARFRKMVRAEWNLIGSRNLRHKFYPGSLFNA